jgi:uncharacterized membrane protein YdbT with pleckstrin-like domain
VIVIEPPQRRWASRIHRFLAPPAASIDDYLTAGERVLHRDLPAVEAFVVEQIPAIVLLIAGLAAVVWGLNSDNVFVAGAALTGAGSLWLYLQIKRWSQQFTLYVLTSARVIHFSGVFTRTVAWIPWVKVTDVRIESSFMGRLLGYATVHIDSANEHSGLSEMKNLHDPRRFHVMLTELVHVKQGHLLDDDESAYLHE